MPGAVALATVLLVVIMVALMYVTVSRRNEPFWLGHQVLLDDIDAQRTRHSAEVAMQRDDVDCGRDPR